MNQKNMPWKVEATSKASLDLQNLGQFLLKFKPVQNLQIATLKAWEWLNHRRLPQDPIDARKAGEEKIFRMQHDFKIKYIILR